MSKDPVAELRDAAWAARCVLPVNQPEWRRLDEALRNFEVNNTVYCPHCQHHESPQDVPYCSEPNCNCVCGG